MAKARKTKVKTIKKAWVQLIAPEIFNKQVIGETLLADSKTAEGKTVPCNLMNLTRDMRNQNYTVKFKVTQVNGQKAETDFIGYDMNSSSLKKMVRRKKSKIVQSSTFKTADDKLIRLKTIMITRNEVSNSVATALRKSNNDTLAREIGKITFDKLSGEVSFHKLQNMLKKSFEKIYPLRMYEVYSLGLEKKKKAKAHEASEELEEDIEEDEDFDEETDSKDTESEENTKEESVTEAKANA